MSDEYRPDPDALLATIRKQEARAGRGKLKIFLGMAAGVGKTYAMLQAAHEAAGMGIDVVAGYVETHNRAETEELLAGLTVIPRLPVQYRGKALEEMDLDGILRRAPQLVLVDELAHTNMPGVRHAKRYQDVLEILGDGIDVYTTVNVQHFESRADAVRQITGVTIHETVPDSLLDLADEIELIDLTPEELHRRLAEGKVYTAERSEVATRNFFRAGNLTALREMALRLTAEHVDHKLQDYMDIKRIAGPWKSAERLMVAVGPSPFSERLVRWTRRMAYNLEAPWLAANVQTTTPRSPAAQQQLSHNLTLARSLGGEVVTTAGDDVAEALLSLARQRNVTQIVIGKTPRQPDGKTFGVKWPAPFGRPSFIDQVIEASGDIDVYVITGDDVDGRPRRMLNLPSLVNRSPWQNYLWAALVIIAITLVDALLVSRLPLISYLTVGLTELLAVLIVAVRLGRGPGLLAATLSASSWNFLFIEPRFTLQISRSQDILLFLLYFVIAIIAGNLAARLRSQEQLARSHAERTTALYSLAREIATAVDMDDVVRVALTHIDRVFDAQTTILLTDGSALRPRPHPAGTLPIDDKDLSVAVWAFENRKAAGRFTATLPLASAQFLPLQASNRSVGVLGIRTRAEARPTFEQEMLLETFAGQVAMAVERELLDDAMQHNAMLRESERLYGTLLNSISHELRTPLATITGAAGSLINPSTGGNGEMRTQLIRDIQDASDRLNRLVANLLDMSRLESGRLNLKREWCDVGDIISVAVERLAACLGQRELTIRLEPDLPLLQLDFVLMEQAFVNLLDNACNHTPAGTPVEIEAVRKGDSVAVTVTDHGPGIAAADLPHIFDKFYRAPGATSAGTGLGLSIARGLVEAHGGTLTAEPVRKAGARFTVRLPASGAPPPVQEATL